MKVVARRLSARWTRSLVVAGLVAGLVVGCTPPDEPTGHRAPAETTRSARAEVARIA